MSMHLVSKVNNGDLCLADSATTHTIIKDKKYFSSLIMQEANVNTISGIAKIIEGSGRANIMLSGGTKFHINVALYSPKSQRNLLSFKDIRNNRYHVETANKRDIEYLCITSMFSGNKCILEKLPAFFLWHVLHLY